MRENKTRFSTSSSGNKIFLISNFGGVYM